MVRSVLARYGMLNARQDAGAFYIGLGDQFDDDRRLVHETAFNPRPEEPGRIAREAVTPRTCG
jgi:hypothetical protein